MSEPLSRDRIERALQELPSWSLHDGKLRRDLRFDGFPAALSFLVRVGVLAESRGHHPEIYNAHAKVTLELITHDAGGITEKDLSFAREVEAFTP